MEYQIEYIFNGTKGIYYVTINRSDLHLSEIVFSLEASLKRHLNYKSEEHKLKILSYNIVT